MRKALVIGSNGQDGTFLVRHLLEKKYNVIGIGRQQESRWKIDSPLFAYHQADLRQTDILSEPLNSLRPDLIFHVAVVHTSAGGNYETQFNDVLKVNVASVYTVLEYLRLNPNSCFIYASSSKVFGDPLPPFIDEATPLKNQCLYSISKNTAYHLIDYYRKQYGVRASVVYLFNHESELRPNSFFIPIVLNCLGSALHDSKHATQINTLNFYCDWGSAEEYMSIIIELIEKAPAEDFVLASGTCTYARNLVRDFFKEYGFNYELHLKERDYSKHSPNNPYAVDLSKLDRFIHRTPRVSIYDVCKKILAKKYGI